MTLGPKHAPTFCSSRPYSDSCFSASSAIFPAEVLGKSLDISSLLHVLISDVGLLPVSSGESK